MNALIALWTESFGDLSNERLEAAFQKALAGCKFWPIKVADVREHVEELGKRELSLKTEAAWQKLLEWIRLHYSPDLGIDRHAPQLEPAVWHAAKAAGGIRLLHSCASEDLVWRKKEFIAYYTTVHETGKAEHLLIDAESKKLLQQIRDGAPHVDRKQLEDSREETHRTQFMTPEDLPPPAPKRFEHPPKCAREQLEELRKRGWLPAGGNG